MKTTFNKEILVKKFIYLPLALIACIASVSGLEPSHAQTEVKEHQKVQFVDSILNEYKEGKHSSFLNQLDEHYQSARKKWKYNQLLEERKALSKVVKGFEQERPPQLEKKIHKLSEMLDRELMDFCLENPHSILSKEVKEMVLFTPTNVEKESLNFIEKIKRKFEGDGKSPLENRLIAIDTEFWLKSSEIESELIQNTIDRDLFITKTLILHLEKLRQMQVACEQDKSSEAVDSHIETARAIFSKVHTAALTKKYLLALANEKTAPQNHEEEQLKAIVLKYQKQEQELINTYFSQNQK